MSFFCRRESTSRASSGPNTEKRNFENRNTTSSPVLPHINDSYFRTACVITMLVNIPYVGSSLLPNSTGKNTEKNIRQYWHYSTRKKMIDLCRIQRRKICGASVSNSLPLPFPFGSRKKRYGKLANIRLFSSKNEGFVCAFLEMSRMTTTAEAEAKKSSQPTTGGEEKKNPSILYRCIEKLPRSPQVYVLRRDGKVDSPGCP